MEGGWWGGVIFLGPALGRGRGNSRFFHTGRPWFALARFLLRALARSRPRVRVRRHASCLRASLMPADRHASCTSQAPCHAHGTPLALFNSHASARPRYSTPFPCVFTVLCLCSAVNMACVLHSHATRALRSRRVFSSLFRAPIRRVCRDSSRTKLREQYQRLMHQECVRCAFALLFALLLRAARIFYSRAISST